MNNDNNGWGNSTVATKYIWQYVDTILDLGGDPDLQNATADRQLDYMCRELSALSLSLARSYRADTGQRIGAPDVDLLRTRQQIIEEAEKGD